LKKYIIYNNITKEEYAVGYNDFTAMNNLASLRKRHGKDNINIKWVDENNDR
jgi:hypothetical protein